MPKKGSGRGGSIGVRRKQPGHRRGKKSALPPDPHPPSAAEKQRLLEEGRLERDRLVVQSVPGQLPAPADLYEDEAVAVRESAIEGLGLFARRPFKAGEAVLTWRPKRLSEAEFRDTPAPLRRYLGVLDDGTKVLMQSPERYVNSAAEPNTCTAGESDVALRDIEAGEELTSSYPLKEL